MSVSYSANDVEVQSITIIPVTTIQVKQQLRKSPYVPELEFIPKFLRYGPWSPTAYIFLVVMIGGMINYASSAITLSPSFEVSHWNETSLWSGIWRLLLFLYGFAVVSFMCLKFASWPLLSFTMMSWNLFTGRYFVTALLHFGCSWEWLFTVSEVLRFPALVCNSITVSVWWLIIFPSIALFIPSKTGRKEFFKFNRSAFLINVHLLNLPLAALDHLADPRMLFSSNTLYMDINSTLF